MKTRPKVFISYSSADRHHAERLVASLVLNAIQVWYDQFDLDVGQNVYTRIQEGLLAVDHLAIVLTARSLESSWVHEELSLAKQRELEERHVIILPLLFEQVPLPLHLRARKYADFTDFSTGLRELMRVLGRHAAVQEIDESLRRKAREAISRIASGVADDVQTIRSQQMARIIRGTSLGLAQAEKRVDLDLDVETRSPATVFVDIRSADASIPIAVDLSERSGSVLSRLLQAISLDMLVANEQRFSFLMLFDDIPLELDETLLDAGVTDGAHLRLAAYTFMIE